MPYDALLLVSFGAPERRDDVLPFLENLLEGKHVPRQRLLEVAARYELLGGASPLNAQNRALMAALIQEFRGHGLEIPVYWGNRNWHPFLAEAVHQMALDGVRRALAFVTSAFGSYPGCRQYLDDLELARQQVGPDAPRIEKLRLFYNHPGFIEPMAERVAAALEQVPAQRRAATRTIYTAHSIPVIMARTSPYENQLCEACRLVSERLGRIEWELAYQSRSGPPSQPWLGPDVSDSLRQLAQQCGDADVVVTPIGFVCEHMETVYDLDVAAHDLCQELGLNMVRAGTIGCHARFVQMIRELVQERMGSTSERLALGQDGPHPDQCPADCCRHG